VEHESTSSAEVQEIRNRQLKRMLVHNGSETAPKYHMANKEVQRLLPQRIRAHGGLPNVTFGK